MHWWQKKVKKLAKLPNGTHNDDPLAADDDDVARIAREMEAKYVSSVLVHKHRKCERDSKMCKFFYEWICSATW